MSEKVYMTQEGYDKAKERLSFLKTQKRVEITEKIKDARGHGDLSENAEYDAARNEQAMLEGEIQELEARLKIVEIIAAPKSKDVVTIGSKVKVYDEEFDETETYEIVGTAEADPRHNRISNESPFGKGLIGRKAGDVAEIAAPKGIVKLKVLSID